ncbi:hypothetical protein LIER_36728 [Lithospermum erythrorhizon]|uniref:WRKY domain-containing protein n=1 Tax=Lithospermum erythrorhizon TaxID=34254 RepID=A0AAV3PA96_LITER
MVKPVDAMQGGYRDTINPPTDSTLVANWAPESPPSPIGSPRSQDISDASKKRKAMPRWTKQVQVNPGSVSEGSLDDGHNWRKYGQKDILGAKYPRYQISISDDSVFIIIFQKMYALLNLS